MFSRFVFTVCFAISMVFCSAAVFAGKIELTTYYPAPHGEYKNLNSTESSNFATISGNVGIGTTTPDSNYKLDVNGDAKINGLTVGRGLGDIATNTAVGESALYSNTDGSKNTAIGAEALYSNATGKWNTASGFKSLYANTTGFCNTASGMQSLLTNTEGSNNTATGHQSLLFNTTGNYNTGHGFQSLNANTTGNSNTAQGYQSLVNNLTGNFNTAQGYQSLIYNTTGVGNVAIGYQALVSQAAGTGNTTGSYNVAIGFAAGMNITTGSNNIMIGNGALASSAAATNEVTLGNTSTSRVRCGTEGFQTLSDARDKKDIVPLPFGLDFISSLKPVAFTWNTRDGAKVGIKSSGFIAQDLKAAQDSVGAAATLNLVDEANPDRLEATPGKLLPVLVKAIQEQQAEIKLLKAEVAELKKR